MRENCRSRDEPEGVKVEVCAPTSTVFLSQVCRPELGLKSSQILAYFRHIPVALQSYSSVSSTFRAVWLSVQDVRTRLHTLLLSRDPILKVPRILPYSASLAKQIFKALLSFARTENTGTPCSGQSLVLSTRCACQPSNCHKPSATTHTRMHDNGDCDKRKDYCCPRVFHRAYSECHRRRS